MQGDPDDRTTSRSRSARWSATAATPTVAGMPFLAGVLPVSPVTNAGASTLDADPGVRPGTATTGVPPGTVHAGGAPALQAQSNLTTDYDDDLINGALACHVHRQVSSSATPGTNSDFTASSWR